MFLEDIESNRSILKERIKNKRILVIGGAGSIGSSFIRAVLPFQPAQLVVVDISENGLVELTRDLRSTYGMFVPDDYKTYTLDFDSDIFRSIFRQNGGFEIIANFSAHKHVRSEKDRWSVQALLENNVLKAKRLLDLLSEYPPERFFCVSTDKAANPVNIMGASKRIMEDMIMAYSERFNVTTARFANVAFSQGSLLAGFIERIMKKQPLSSPYDVKRYFVSLEESGQICMLACVLANNRELLFPKLKEEQMLTFSSIAEKMLQTLGYEIKYCESEEAARRFAAEMPFDSIKYPVYFFRSDTTGEKSYEEFFIQGEHIDLDRYHALGVIDSISPCPMDKINKLLDDLKRILDNEESTKEDIVSELKEYLPNFTHEEKGRNLDQKM